MNIEKGDIELRSEDVQDIISFVPGWMIRWGNTVILILIVFGIIISYLVKYPDTITSQISITTTVPPAHLVSKSEGKLMFLLIAENDLVSKDQVLAIIENKAENKDVESLKRFLKDFNLDKSEWENENFETYKLGEIQSSFLSFQEAWKNYQLQMKLLPEKKEASAIENQIKEYASLTQKQSVQVTNFKEEHAHLYLGPKFNPGIGLAPDYGTNMGLMYADNAVFYAFLVVGKHLKLLVIQGLDHQQVFVLLFFQGYLLIGVQ